MSNLVCGSANLKVEEICDRVWFRNCTSPDGSFAWVFRVFHGSFLCVSRVLCVSGSFFVALSRVFWGGFDATPFFLSLRVLGCSATEATGLGFVCFVVSNLLCYWPIELIWAFF